MRYIISAAMCIALLGAASPSPGIDVQKQFAHIAPRLKAQVKIPVLLPARLPGTFAGETLFLLVDKASPKSYAVDIALSANCQGEHACSEGHLYGSATPINTNDVPPGGTRVTLKNGTVATYRKSTVAAYPSDAYLSWKQNGSYYSLALNAGSLADLLLTARSMLSA